MISSAEVPNHDLDVGKVRKSFRDTRHALWEVGFVEMHMQFLDHVLCRMRHPVEPEGVVVVRKHFGFRGVILPPLCNDESVRHEDHSFYLIVHQAAAAHHVGSVW